MDENAVIIRNSDREFAVQLNVKELRFPVQKKIIMRNLKTKITVLVCLFMEIKPHAVFIL